MHVALVTTGGERVAVLDRDRPLHDAAFEDRGAQLSHPFWDDPAVDWSAYDLVILRSPWDYTERLAEFLRWLDSVSSLQTLHNPAAVVRWNLDKRYLADLVRHGVPVVPTAYVASAEGWADAVRSLPPLEGSPEASREVVVKPSVSAGSRLTGRFAVGDPAAEALAADILADGKEVLVQPCVPSVAVGGELAVVCFDGEPSHAVLKGPILTTGGARAASSGGEVSPTEADSAALEVVAETLGAVAAVGRARGWGPGAERLLYARIDLMAMPDRTWAVSEAELFEPSFFLPEAPGAAGRFADAVLERATASGL